MSRDHAGASHCLEQPGDLCRTGIAVDRIPIDKSVDETVQAHTATVGWG